jgi:hypothetical protein
MTAYTDLFLYPEQPPMKSSTRELARFVLVCAVSLPLAALAQTVEVSPAVQHDHLPSLRGVMPKPEDMAGVKHVREVKMIPHLSARESRRPRRPG